MRSIQWLAIARTDLLSIVDYISDDNVDAAIRIKEAIETNVSHLKTFPKMGRPGLVEGTREFVIMKNFIVVYQESGVSVKILRVLHA
ncbi:MAG: type II toxin-antitoxin system RelE/ParE family toxin, partial [Oceanospirillaceae bacterium]|nr:type II toxin-antitoxin system RelE/ParE family toxin [Oceanospirillaceae bacterium]